MNLSCEGNVSRKRALLLEFDHSIAVGKLHLASVVGPHLWSSYEAPPISALCSAQRHSSFISPSQSFGPRKIRIHSDPAEEFWRICYNVLSKLNKRKEAPAFQLPVDPIRQKIPDYFKYIKTPMDLKTIREKLQARVYKTPMEFATDMRQIWKNCATYNQPGHQVRIFGDTLSDLFEKTWLETCIEEKWHHMLIEQDPKVQLGIMMEGQISSLYGALGTLVGAATPAAPSPSAGAAAGRDLSFLEKRKLSVVIGDLPAAELQVVLDIIMEDKPAGINPNSEDEVELDMDMLSSSTLWRLHAFVEQLTGAGAKQAKSKPGTSMAEKTPRLPSSSLAVSAPASANGDTPAESARRRQMDTDSGQDSPQNLKGSGVEMPQAQSLFVRDRQVVVDESATNAGNQSTLVSDSAEQKADVAAINTADWSTLAADTTATASAPPNVEVGGAAAEGDDMWTSFQSVAEQHAVKEDEQKKVEEQRRIEEERIERERKKEEEEEKLKQEEEERQKRLREEEERQQAKQNTANLAEQSDVLLESKSDVSLLEPRMEGPTEAKGLESVELANKEEERVDCKDA